MSQGNAITSLYFSGQGILLVADRDGSTGNPLGFRNVGNVSALTLAVEQNTIDHKESSTGSRAIDKRLTEETKLNFAATFEDFSRENMDIATYGNSSTVIAGSATDEVMRDGNGAELGKTNRLEHINVSSVVVTGPVGTPVYELAKNYEVNAESGSIYLYTDAEQTARAATVNIVEGAAIEVDYSYTTYEQVQGLTQARRELWFRFEGLNTADSNSPVTVDLFKVDVDPLQELALINDEFGQIELEGFALADQTKLTGSKFFEMNYFRSFTVTL